MDEAKVSILFNSIDNKLNILLFLYSNYNNNLYSMCNFYYNYDCFDSSKTHINTEKQKIIYNYLLKEDKPNKQEKRWNKINKGRNR